MTMPLLVYKPTAQNHRVQGFGVLDSPPECGFPGRINSFLRPERGIIGQKTVD